MMNKVRASEATVENMVTLPNGMKCLAVNILDVCATYIGEDEYFEYWKDTKGNVYGL